MTQPTRDAPKAVGTPRGEAQFRHSESLPSVLKRAGCSLLVSTYQAGQLIAIGTHEDRVTFSFFPLDQAMGIAVGPGQVAVGAKDQVWFFRDHSELASSVEPAGQHDRYFLPRSSSITGAIQCHELGWPVDSSGEPDLWVVNTLFSCLAGLDPAYSFVPRWRPPFISRLAPEDRCHLNGLAMREGSPAFVTAMAVSDEPAGWRATRNDSGVVVDVDSGEVVTSGLAMPHSPRWYSDNLFVLNSGRGLLEHVDLATGSRGAVAALPGYARGLAIHHGLAFVGLSRIRETAIFGGAPIAEYHDQLKCGIGVIELATGSTVATLEFTSGIEEIFDVQVLPDARSAALGSPPGVGPETWVVPLPMDG